MVIRPLDAGLAMHQLHFQAEVRTMNDLGVEAAPVSEAEMTLANQLVQHLSVKRFDPHEFVDEFKGRVEAAIERKVQGKEVSLAEAPVTSSKANVIDLMAALKASLNAREKKPSEIKERKAPKRAATAAPRKSARR